MFKFLQKLRSGAQKGFEEVRIFENPDIFSREKMINSAVYKMGDFVHFFPQGFTCESEPIYSDDKKDQNGWPMAYGRLFRITSLKTSFQRHEISDEIRAEIIEELNAHPRTKQLRTLIHEGIPEHQRFPGMADPDGNPNVDIEFAFVKAPAHKKDTEERYELGIIIRNNDDGVHFQTANNGTILGTILFQLQPWESRARQQHIADKQNAEMHVGTPPVAQVQRLDLL